MNQKERIRRQIIHSQNRFKERYGNEITVEQIQELIGDVQTGYCQPLAEVSCMVSVFRSGDWIFVYDSKRHNIMTFLEEFMVDGYIKKEQLRQKRSLMGKHIKMSEADLDDINSQMLQHIS